MRKQLQWAKNTGIGSVGNGFYGNGNLWKSVPWRGKSNFEVIGSKDQWMFQGDNMNSLLIAVVYHGEAWLWCKRGLGLLWWHSSTRWTVTYCSDLCTLSPCFFHLSATYIYKVGFMNLGSLRIISMLQTLYPFIFHKVKVTKITCFIVSWIFV